MNENFHIGIDIGSEYIKIILASKKTKEGLLKIFAKQRFPSTGVSAGYISNKNELIKSLKKAIFLFEKTNKIKIEEASFSIDTLGTVSQVNKISQTTSAGVISEIEIEQLEKKLSMLNKKLSNEAILHQQILSYDINGFDQYNNPQGLETKKFTAKYFTLLSNKNNIFLLEEIAEELNIVPLSINHASLCSAEVSLKTIDKKMATALLSFGAEKTSLIIFEKGNPVHFFDIKYGSKNLNKEISKELKITFEEAEKEKKSKVKKTQTKKIIKKELSSLAKKIKKELLNSNFEILPAGIIITGGGTKVDFIKEIFKKEIKLPIKRPELLIEDTDTDYQVAYGAVALTLKENNKKTKFKLPKISNPFKNIIKKFII